jgi:hypothetical protein
MGFVGTFVHRAITDAGLDDDQRRVFALFGFANGFGDGGDVVAILNLKDIPFAGEETQFDVLA